MPYDDASPQVRRARELADQRYGQALWYAFGNIDAGNTDMHSGHAFEFATFHKDQAYNYYDPNNRETHHLPSVQHAWEEFCGKVSRRAPHIQ